MKNKTEIYVHIPFCNRKCDYCDFVSFVKDDDTKKAYFDALKLQIEKKAETTGKIPVVSCFFGGGTPSSVEPEYIGSVLGTLKRCFDFEENAEITIEMNPNSVSFEKLKKYREYGINRVSIGLQSTNDYELKKLTRLHSYEEFLEAYSLARKAGFENINIDLMSAIPGQSFESYKETLERVVKLSPEHISAYSLILEEGTPFFDRYNEDKSELVDEDTEREMYHFTKRYLSENGYERYEISNYAKKGFECIHNIGYWERTDYIGFGISAASLYRNIRYSVHSDLKRFIDGDFSEDKEELTKEDIIGEFMFLGLRLVKGVSKKKFSELFGKNIEEIYGEQLGRLLRDNLIEADDNIRLTEKGMDISNYCMSEFIL